MQIQYTDASTTWNCTLSWSAKTNSPVFTTKAPAHRSWTLLTYQKLQVEQLPKAWWIHEITVSKEKPSFHHQQWISVVIQTLNPFSGFLFSLKSCQKFQTERSPEKSGFKEWKSWGFSCISSQWTDTPPVLVCKSKKSRCWGWSRFSQRRSVNTGKYHWESGKLSKMVL